MNTLISKGIYRQGNLYDHPIYNEELNKDFLYHFTTLQKLVKITESKSLRASRFELVNDPAESSKHVSWKQPRNSIHEEAELKKQSYQALDMANQVLDKVRRSAHVLCFSVDNSESCGIVRKGYAIPQMWAHYADNQKGVCLIFSKKKLLEEVKNNDLKYIAKDVIYDTSQASGAIIEFSPDEIMKMDEQEFQRACLEESPSLFWFFKDDGWKYEQEFRVVFPIAPKDATFISIEKAVAGICLGIRFSEQSYQHINRFKEAFELKNQESPKILWDKGIGYPSGIPMYQSHFNRQQQVTAEVES